MKCKSFIQSVYNKVEGASLRMKQHRCIMCDKLYSSSQSLWNHKQKCKKKQPIPQYSLQETPENEDNRLETIKIQSHEIDDILEKGMWKMKDEIWNYLLDEGRRTWKGGSVPTWNNVINEKDDPSEQEEEEEEDEEEEKTFRDIVKKDEKRLGEEIDKLSQDLKFNKIAGEIYSLVNSYFNTGLKYKIDKERQRETNIKDLFEILERFSGMDLLKISTIWQLVEKIENIRYIVKILFEAMEIEDDKEKSRKLFSSRIANEEYQELRNNLNPESIKTMLLKRKDTVI